MYRSEESKNILIVDYLVARIGKESPAVFKFTVRRDGNVGMQKMKIYNTIENKENP